MTVKRTPTLLLRGFVVGEYGKTNSVTLVDFDGSAQDVSAYTTSNQVVCRSPDGRKTITSTGAFYTDGSDGVETWSFSSGDPLDRPGFWSCQVVLTKSDSELRSYPFDLEVMEEL